jgi:hypothetical protein
LESETLATAIVASTIPDENRVSSTVIVRGGELLSAAKGAEKKHKRRMVLKKSLIELLELYLWIQQPPNGLVIFSEHAKFVYSADSQGLVKKIVEYVMIRVKQSDPLQKVAPAQFGEKNRSNGNDICGGGLPWKWTGVNQEKIDAVFDAVTEDLMSGRKDGIFGSAAGQPNRNIIIMIYRVEAVCHLDLMLIVGRIPLNNNYLLITEIELYHDVRLCRAI